MPNLGFDPLLYLEINNNPEKKEKLSRELLDQISDYILVRTIEMFPEERLLEIGSAQELFTLAKKYIPDYESKIKAFLEDFKKEFNNG